MSIDPRNGLTSAVWHPRRFRPHPNRLTRWMRSIPRGERANALSHALGLMLFTVLGTGLVLASISRGSIAFIVSVVVFVGSLLAMYTASAIYHGSSVAARKPMFRALDHCSIYLLIAGTYTPFAVDFGGRWGLLVMVVVWLAATIGIGIKLFARIGRRWISTSIHVAMGWLVILVADPFLEHFPLWIIGWLVAGGLAYTAGTPFYLMSRLPYMHTLWHCFVVLGSTFHFIAVASLLPHASHGFG